MKKLLPYDISHTMASADVKMETIPCMRNRNMDKAECKNNIFFIIFSI